MTSNCEKCLLTRLSTQDGKQVICVPPNPVWRKLYLNSTTDIYAQQSVPICDRPNGPIQTKRCLACTKSILKKDTRGINDEYPVNKIFRACYGLPLKEDQYVNLGKIPNPVCVNESQFEPKTFEDYED
ncbi:MAG: hypothetical protein UT06_C0035G0005 [Candidatus Woesebacteria bacterium GW2011_GWA1_38_8]|uniref:Uncharacterized protein n=1 Tax=Candidatus Woesebacteria bacterium GW2011_GWA1_38_8 TaxID=1618547 RepID=A0A0G0P0H3_9BACT|nr:MAG: hypothetical protein UT06_C0035G0005 [Candidatus Woesebacteria bacterium GW2011_GWA1_38_8]